MNGLNKIRNGTNMFCPTNTRTCCSPDDEIVAMNFWNKIVKRKIEKRAKIFNNMIKYLLGYYEEGLSLAKLQKNSFE